MGAIPPHRSLCPGQISSETHRKVTGRAPTSTSHRPPRHSTLAPSTSVPSTAATRAKGGAMEGQGAAGWEQSGWGLDGSGQCFQALELYLFTRICRFVERVQSFLRATSSLSGNCWLYWAVQSVRREFQPKRCVKKNPDGTCACKTNMF